MTARVCRSALVMVWLSAVFACSAAADATSFKPCGDAANQQCATVTVPLDRSGAVAGTVALAVRRVIHGNAAPHGALLVLAGGPGQAANPLLDQVDRALAPTLTTSNLDLVTLDQRGTGRSGRLACAAIDNPLLSIAAAVGGCAAELSSRRSLYRTLDSADDIEAVRQALGVDRLTLSGTSYGTKVALAYAVRYPTHVAALILDSVVTLDGPDPLEHSTLRAVPRVVADACALGCGEVSGDPAGEVARLAGRLSQGPLGGRVTFPSGRRVSVAATSGDLLGLLKQGDFDVSLRADLPAVARAANHGDVTPLLRLVLRAGATGGSVAGRGSMSAVGGTGFAVGEPPDDSNNTVFTATTCEELGFPWTRSAGVLARARQTESALQSAPAGAFGRFPGRFVLGDPLLQHCLFWPADARPPSLDGPLPQVPVLTLAGYDDLRAPLEDASAVAASIPGAVSVVANGTGHSVLTNDPACAVAAIDGLLSGAPRVPSVCAAVSLRLRPAGPIPEAPGGLAPLGVGGRPGRTARAVVLTVQDALRQAVFLSVSLRGSQRVHFGGLRGGTIDVGPADARLRNYEYVPGVLLSGTLGAAGARVSVRATGVTGSVHLLHGRLVGTLGGHRIDARFSIPDPVVRTAGVASPRVGPVVGPAGTARLGGGSTARVERLAVSVGMP